MPQTHLQLEDYAQHLIGDDRPRFAREVARAIESVHPLRGIDEDEAVRLFGRGAPIAILRSFSPDDPRATELSVGTPRELPTSGARLAACTPEELRAATVAAHCFAADRNYNGEDAAELSIWLEYYRRAVARVNGTEVEA